MPTVADALNTLLIGVVVTSHRVKVDDNGECFLWEPRYTKHLHPKVLRQLVIFASASHLEVSARVPIEHRFDRYGAENVDKYLKAVQDFAQSRTPVLRASDGLHVFSLLCHLLVGVRARAREKQRESVCTCERDGQIERQRETERV